MYDLRENNDADNALVNNIGKYLSLSFWYNPDSSLPLSLTVDGVPFDSWEPISPHCALHSEMWSSVAKVLNASKKIWTPHYDATVSYPYLLQYHHAPDTQSEVCPAVSHLLGDIVACDIIQHLTKTHVSYSKSDKEG